MAFSSPSNISASKSWEALWARPVNSKMAPGWNLASRRRLKKAADAAPSKQWSWDKILPRIVESETIREDLLVSRKLDRGCKWGWPETCSILLPPGRINEFKG